MQGCVTTRLEHNMDAHTRRPWKEYVQHLSNQVSTLRRAYRSSRAGCAGCEKNETMETKFSTCSVCNLTKYCSRQCQVQDWKSHRKVCTLLVKVDIGDDCSTKESMGWKAAWYQRLQKKWSKAKRPILGGFHVQGSYT